MGLGFDFSGLGFKISGLGFDVLGLGFEILDPGFEILGLVNDALSLRLQSFRFGLGLIFRSQ